MRVGLLAGRGLTIVKSPGEIVCAVDDGVFPGFREYLGLSPLVLVAAKNRRYPAVLIKYRAPGFSPLLLSRSSGSDDPVEEVGIVIDKDIFRLVSAPYFC